MPEKNSTINGIQPAAVDKSVSPSVAPVVKELEMLFKKFNAHFFNSILLMPVITLSQRGTKSAKGWCTEKKVWAQTGGDADSERFYEINICPEYLNQPVEEICGVLLHEMVHLFDIMKGIQDCTSNGQYHNKHFKESAEEHGLKAEKTERYGYAKTSLKSETVEFINQLDLTTFALYRNSVQEVPQDSDDDKSAKRASSRRTSSTRIYVCPKCETLIRATKEVRVRCDCCNELFREREELEREKVGIYASHRRKW